MKTVKETVLANRSHDFQNKVITMLSDYGIDDHDGLWVIIGIMEAYAQEIEKTGSEFNKSLSESKAEIIKIKDESKREIREFLELAGQSQFASFCEKIEEYEIPFVNKVNDTLCENNDKIRDIIKNETDKIRGMVYQDEPSYKPFEEDQEKQIRYVKNNHGGGGLFSAVAGISICVGAMMAGALFSAEILGLLGLG